MIFQIYGIWHNFSQPPLTFSLHVFGIYFVKVDTTLPSDAQLKI